MLNTFCPGRGSNQDLLRGSQTLYRVAIKAGLYRKAVQVCIIPNITTVLKQLSQEISPVVALIFQTSLDSGTVPTEWKTAQVCPLFKKGDKTDPANHRPISLTCILCKTMEHIVASSLTKHFNQNDILYDLQHGFRERRSCETQLI